MNFEKEECFDRCRAILRVLDQCRLDEPDRDTLIWMALEYLEHLGEIIGIAASK